MSAPIPLPTEVVPSIGWISTTPPEAVLAFWQEQRANLARLVRDSAPIQKASFASAPPVLAGAQSRF